MKADFEIQEDVHFSFKQVFFRCVLRFVKFIYLFQLSCFIHEPKSTKFVSFSSNKLFFSLETRTLCCCDKFVTKSFLRTLTFLFEI